MSSSDDRLKWSFQESVTLFRLRNENVLKALKLRDVKFRTVWPLTVMNGAKERAFTRSWTIMALIIDRFGFPV